MTLTSVLLQAGGGTAQIMNIVMIVGMLAVFYFFMIRPQQKKQKDQKNFSDSLKRGDSVITISGLHGKVTEIEGTSVLLEIDKGVKVRVERSAISLDYTNAVYGKKA